MEEKADYQGENNYEAQGFAASGTRLFKISRTGTEGTEKQGGPSRKRRPPSLKSRAGFYCKVRPFSAGPTEIGFTSAKAAGSIPGINS